MTEVLEKVSWNQGQLHAMELAKLRSISNEAYIGGNLVKAIETLIAMNMTANYLYNKDEIESIEEIEKKLDPLMMLIKYLGSFNPVENQRATQAISIIRPLLREYNKITQRILDKYGMFGDKKKDSSRMVIFNK